MLNKEFEESPFQPEHPVSPDNFKGRQKDITKIIRYLPRVINQGIPEHYFITGKRGMGKTSFAKYIGHLAEDNYQMVHIYVNNEGTHTITELIQNLLEKMFKEFNKESWGRKIVKKFINNIEKIDVSGIGVTLKDNPELVENIKDNFGEFLVDICKSLNDKKGIFIVIDDVNGLSDTLHFTNWYKGLFETLDFDGCFVPVAFTLVTYEDKFDKLCDENPSFCRMFHLINIDHLNDDDIKDFYIDIFNSQGIKFKDDNCLKNMIYYSWGMPLVMQQIRDSVFWNVETDYINANIAYAGIIDAAFEFGNRQIKNKLKMIESDYYENILLKLGEHESMTFNKSEAESFLSDDEKNVFDDFLKNMYELDIIEPVGRINAENYAFMNRLYFVYFLIKSKLEKEKT